MRRRILLALMLAGTVFAAEAPPPDVTKVPTDVLQARQAAIEAQIQTLQAQFALLPYQFKDLQAQKDVIDKELVKRAKATPAPKK